MKYYIRLSKLKLPFVRIFLVKDPKGNTVETYCRFHLPECFRYPKHLLSYLTYLRSVIDFNRRFRSLLEYEETASLAENMLAQKSITDKRLVEALPVFHEQKRKLLEKKQKLKVGV